MAAFRELGDRDDPDDGEAAGSRARLLQTCAGLVRQIAGPTAPPFVLPPDLPFAVGVNALCQHLIMEVDQRQKLLEIDDVMVRCRALVVILTEVWKEAAGRRQEPGVTH